MIKDKDVPAFDNFTKEKKGKKQERKKRVSVERNFVIYELGLINFSARINRVK